MSDFFYILEKGIVDVYKSTIISSDNLIATLYSNFH